MSKSPSNSKLEPTSIKNLYLLGIIFTAVIAYSVGHNSGRVPGISSNDISQEISGSKELSSLLTELKSSYDGKISDEDVKNALKKGIAESANDPYTVYFTKAEAADFQSSLNGTFTGIGAELGKEGEQLIIVTPLDNSPAQAAGIQAKDAIIQVDGINTEGWSVEQAVTKIRGAKGTTVVLKLVRSGQVIETSIVRDEIKDPSVKSEILEGNIGYIRISRFGDDTSDLATKAAQSMKDANVKGVILDLRNNGGGYLTAAIDVSNLWLKPGEVIVRQKSNGVEKEVTKANGNPILNGIKTVVLVNGASASASEIVAGALHDNGSATLLGEKTFGKGSVQAPKNLSDGGMLKVTIARWYTPKNQNIDKQGIPVDINLPLDLEAFKNKVDNQKTAAIDEINK